MRKFAALLALAVLGTRATPVAAEYDFTGHWTEPGFDLHACVARATHILVVNPAGRVLEVWKGKSTPGDRIPVERFYGPALPRLTATSVEREWHLPPLHDHRGADGFGSPLCSDRLILFLVKSDREDETAKFLGGWLPASPDGWFISSTARVRVLGDVRDVTFMPQPYRGGVGFSGHGGSEETFKEWVMDVIRADQNRKWSLYW